MAPTRRRLLGATAAAVTLAGCLSNGDDPGQADPTATVTPTPTDSGSSGGTDTATDAGASLSVEVRSHDEHGDILVDADGMTLYMFDQDSRGADSSACTGGCAEAWPPLTTSSDVQAGMDVTASLSTLERADGDRQVAADGWPLYYYANDSSPGDATGQGVGGVWWVLAPDGTPVRPSSSPTATDTDTDAGGGGGSGDGGRYGY